MSDAKRLFVALEIPRSCKPALLPREGAKHRVEMHQDF